MNIYNDHWSAKGVDTRHNALFVFLESVEVAEDLLLLKPYLLGNVVLMRYETTTRTLFERQRERKRT